MTADRTAQMGADIRANLRVNQRQSASLWVVVIAGVLMAALGGFYALSDPDVRLCHRVLAQLVNADLAVSRSIDWDHLQALDANVGATYAALQNREERVGYERAFIRNFAEGFRKSGGRLSAFTHWRAEPDGTVSADYPAKQKTLVFRLSGRRQVDGIAWKTQMTADADDRRNADHRR